MFFFNVSTRVVSCFSLLWFDLFSSPLLTFDLSDLETSVDSRCTTDSADSAFIGRRYWFPASFLPFLSSNHPLPSPSTQEVRLQIRLQDKKRLLCSYFFPDYYRVNTELSFFLFACSSVFFISLHYLLKPAYILCLSVLYVCIHVYSIICLYVFCKFASMFYSYFLLSRHLISVCVFCVHVFKAELHDGAHSQIRLIKINIMLTHRQWLWHVCTHT